VVAAAEGSELAGDLVAEPMNRRRPRAVTFHDCRAGGADLVTAVG